MNAHSVRAIHKRYLFDFDANLLLWDGSIESATFCVNEIMTHEYHLLSWMPAFFIS